MWESDYNRGWGPKNWSFGAVVLEKTLDSLLNSKEIKPVNPEGNQPWIFLGMTNVETPILWQPDMKSRLIEKYPDAGQDWGQEEKGATEDKMVGWHHWLNGHEFEQTLGDSEGQESLFCCRYWGCRVRCDFVTEQQQLRSRHQDMIKCAMILWEEILT